ncbi:ABC transporter substrate-binding protein [Rhodococcus wratislaviensis]|nr:ABC transporter substrate-binding protein [Rhodococcus wratislaviensis]
MNDCTESFSATKRPDKQETQMLDKRSAITIAGALALLSSMVACGSAGTAPTSENGLTSITIGSMESNSLSFPYTIAQEQGFFQGAGLQVETVTAPSGPQLTAALIGNTTQIAIGTPENVMGAMNQGQQITAIPPFGHIDMSLVTPADSGITDVTSLRGKQIGVVQRGSASERFARTVLSGNGVDPDSVTYVAVGAGATMEPAVRNKKVDATVGSTSTVVTMEDHGIEFRTLASPFDGTAGELGDVGLQTFWTTTEEFAQQNPEILNGFCTAMNKAADWIADDANRGSGVQSLATLLRIPAESAGRIWDKTHLSWSPTINEATWTANVDWILGDGSSGLSFEQAVMPECA